MNIDRQSLASNFLAANGWQGASTSLLAGDASNRSYDRVVHPDGRNAVLMNAPIDKGENPEVFVQVTNILRGYGYSAPEVLASDLTNGFLLIEDLGDDLFARICKTNPDAEHELYQGAVKLLADLHQHAAPDQLAPYDQAVYDREANLAVEWYLPALIKNVSDECGKEFRLLIQSACAKISGHKPVLVMRDYHAENLIWLPKREGIQRVGLLDYQDALAGHPAYDLVSLLEDARRDTSADLQKKLFNYYVEITKTDPDEFRLAYDILGAQRNLKIVGIFTRLFVRDGKASYLDLIPRVWAHLQRDLSNPELSELGTWVRQNLPEPTQDNLNKIRGGNA